MAGNKKIKKHPKSEEVISGNRSQRVTHADAKKRAEEIKEKLIRVEVDLIAAKRRSIKEHLQQYDTLPPPEEHVARDLGPGRLPLAQIQELKKMLYYKLAEWIITLILIAGISAWLYKWWLLKVGGN